MNRFIIICLALFIFLFSNFCLGDEPGKRPGRPGRLVGIPPKPGTPGYSDYITEMIEGHEGKTESDEESSDIIREFSNPDEIVEVERGEIFGIVVDKAPEEHRWEFDFDNWPDDTIFQYKGVDRTDPEKEVWKIRAIDKGESAVSLQCIRGYQSEIEVLKKVVFNVKIHPEETPERTVRLTRSDKGSTVRLHPDDILEVSVVSKAPSGFFWKIKSIDESILQKAGGSYESYGGIGAAGDLIMRFKPVSSGETVLKIIEENARDGSANDTIEVTVIVEGN